MSTDRYLRLKIRLYSVLGHFLSKRGKLLNMRIEELYIIENQALALFIIDMV